MLKPLLRLFYNPQRANQKMLRPLHALVAQINKLEPEYQQLSDAELAAKTGDFREKLAQGAQLDSLLVPAFATVREASRRILGMRHFDVQLIGGMVLHRGMIAEMKTGEGKTLVATLPVYLNALEGKGVHVVTVNDYLATRDSSIMAPLYQFLGLSVGCIVQDLSSSQRYAAYHADITYGTNNEFGFDFLKDNMKFKTTDMCQRSFNYAIVDEVDSILIDEARTPLIISGQSEDASDMYQTINNIVLKLKPEHFEKDEKNKNVYFTEAGYEAVEQYTKEAGLIGDEQLFQPKNLSLVHHLNQSLRAQKIYYREIDYIVRQGQVVLIDEFTGRMMKGRRFSDGLHQALEAKEHVEIEAENQTLASITFQNYFRMYKKLSGMTGTAETEAAEFQDIYKLSVVTIPTNVPVQRQDLDDEIFRTFEQKKKAILTLIKECHARRQPVLVGTLSIEKSEIFATALEKEGLKFSVLNARHHEKEAQIIAQAGAPEAITIATNMAGRGTDIKLGGNVESMLHEALEGVEDPEERTRITAQVKEHHRGLEAEARAAGGLFVLGTERNENRRIDNQLRGRTGRQGDPGASKFFISLEDDLMRIFGPNVQMLENSMKKSETLNDHDPIAHPWLTRSIEKAQQRIEAQHFDTRKHLLKYADVLNAQRSAVYAERRHVMDLTSEEVRELTRDIRRHACEHLVKTQWGQSSQEDADIRGVIPAVNAVFGVLVPQSDQPLTSIEDTVSYVWPLIAEHETKREEAWGIDEYANMEKQALLRALDQVWVKHLNVLDQVRSGIHLQAYGQKDPLNEYRHEAFALFHDMKSQWHATFLEKILHAQPQTPWQYAHDDHEDDDDEDGDADQDMSMEDLLAHWKRMLQGSNSDMTEDDWSQLSTALLESSDDDQESENERDDVGPLIRASKRSVTDTSGTTQPRDKRSVSSGSKKDKTKVSTARTTTQERSKPLSSSSRSPRYSGKEEGRHQDVPKQQRPKAQTLDRAQTSVAERPKKTSALSQRRQDESLVASKRDGVAQVSRRRGSSGPDRFRGPESDKGSDRRGNTVEKNSGKTRSVGNQRTESSTMGRASTPRSDVESTKRKHVSVGMSSGSVRGTRGGSDTRKRDVYGDPTRDTERPFSPSPQRGRDQQRHRADDTGTGQKPVKKYSRKQTPVSMGSTFDKETRGRSRLSQRSEETSIGQKGGKSRPAVRFGSLASSGGSKGRSVNGASRSKAGNFEARTSDHRHITGRAPKRLDDGTNAGKGRPPIVSGQDARRGPAKPRLMIVPKSPRKPKTPR